METLRLGLGLLVVLCLLCSVVGLFRLIAILPEGDVDNKLAGEKYRRIVNRRVR